MMNTEQKWLTKLIMDHIYSDRILKRGNQVEDGASRTGLVPSYEEARELAWALSAVCQSDEKAAICNLEKDPHCNLTMLTP